MWQRGSVTVEGARGRKRYVGRYRLPDGTQPKVNLGFVSEITLSEARTKLEATVRELGSRPQSSQSLTFSVYWKLHYSPRHHLSWSEATAHGYESYLRAYIIPAFGNVLLTDFTPDLLSTFFDKLRRKYSRNVVQKCWAMLKAVLEGPQWSPKTGH
jgi:hypothetical protein